MSEAPAGVRLVQPPSWRKAAAFDVENFGVDVWPENVWKEELAAYERTYLALVTDTQIGPGTLVGLGGVTHGPEAEVLTLAVSAHMRGRGLGGYLLGELLQIPRIHGAEAVFLEVRAHDAGAQRLYERAGFVAVGWRRNYYHDDDAVIMRLDLAGA
ncbi:GNAT family N-acetyltransferase [Trueperella pyogenes]|uniref:GNAT family N-acetyltransferase n=1 Tax=Trueperella pyogenes TaxID=1661 RepID=UPI00046AB633|nr:GNAT family N-acetyltransferase [Trueperella pyogenes]